MIDASNHDFGDGGTGDARRQIMHTTDYGYQMKAQIQEI